VCLYAYLTTVLQSRLCIILIHATLEGVLAFLNHFPLFSLMLRLKDPDRLPGGLAFSVMATAHLPILQLRVVWIYSLLLMAAYLSNAEQSDFHVRYIPPVLGAMVEFQPALLAFLPAWQDP
jgi:hypothetical protein